MEIVTTVGDVRARVAAWVARGERVVLVPTMGNLHAGHTSLLTLGRRYGTRLVATVFVNPTQFGPAEDFSSYPRTPEEDVRALEAAGCNLLFRPAVGDIYPDGADAATRIDVPGLSSILCGAFRPGHFSGVATVVATLFHIVEPDVAVFGEKDYQQLVVIRKMVSDLQLRVAIVGAPTIREADGLAMSSRNQYLLPEERRVAPTLYAELSRIARGLADGERDFARLERESVAALEAAGFRTDYVSVRTAGTLALPAAHDRLLVVLAAARLGAARLIDNVQITTD
jgi:pantoate--beta-alanine ligase